MRIDWRGLAKALLLAVTLLSGAAQAGTVQYVYDGLGRLIAVVDETGSTTVYTYDAAGNILSVSGGGAAQLSILSFVPGHGKAGDSVTIYGSRFIANTAQNSVSFNGTPAIVTAATATSLVATVPAGATTGPISVSNANGSAVSANAFSVVEPPTIVGVDPAIVPRGAVTRVQISGTNLRFATAVTFAQAGMTATIAPGATDQLLLVDVRVVIGVPGGSYAFSVVDQAGTTGSGAVTLTVGAAPTGADASVSRPLSVFVPGPAQVAPSGSAMSIASPLSVFLPGSSQVAPSGSALSIALPLSVFVPGATQVAPAGSATSVTPSVSVQMP